MCASEASCSLPLSDFGTVTFASASATLAGHTGAIDDAAWSTVGLQLRQPTSTASGDGRPTKAVVTATPSALANSVFSVSWSDQSVSGEEPTAPTLPGFGGGSWMHDPNRAASRCLTSRRLTRRLCPAMTLEPDEPPTPRVPILRRWQGATSREAADGQRSRSTAASLLELVLIVATAIALALGIQAYVVKPYRIPSGSMEPTLQVGQRVLVDRIGMDFGNPTSARSSSSTPRGRRTGGLRTHSPRRIRGRRSLRRARPQRVERQLHQARRGRAGRQIYIKEGHVYLNGGQSLRARVTTPISSLW